MGTRHGLAAGHQAWATGPTCGSATCPPPAPAPAASSSVTSHPTRITRWVPAAAAAAAPLPLVARQPSTATWQWCCCIVVGARLPATPTRLASLGSLQRYQATPEQRELVRRIRLTTDYYEILSIQRGANDDEVRLLALAVRAAGGSCNIDAWWAARRCGGAAGLQRTTGMRRAALAYPLLPKLAAPLPRRPHTTLPASPCAGEARVSQAGPQAAPWCAAESRRRAGDRGAAAVEGRGPGGGRWWGCSASFPCLICACSLSCDADKNKARGADEAFKGVKTGQGRVQQQGVKRVAGCCSHDRPYLIATPALPLVPPPHDDAAVSKAFTCLSDAGKRRHYDAYGREEVSAACPAAAQGCKGSAGLLLGGRAGQRAWLRCMRLPSNAMLRSAVSAADCGQPGPCWRRRRLPRRRWRLPRRRWRRGLLRWR